MGLKYLAFAAAVGTSFTSGLAFYPALWLARRARAAALCVAMAAVFLSPLLVPPGARPLRFAAMLVAVTVGVSLYDHYWNARAGYRPGPRRFIESLPNPFALALRRVLSEPTPTRRADVIQAVVCSLLGMAAVALLIGVFCIDWRRHLFITEHCAKAISLFLMIQFFPNGLAAAARLAGIPATNFAGAFFLARTPAEFWRMYNRPVNQFFHEYVFKLAGGRAHPITAMLIVFVVSGIIHEYVFDLTLGRILGSQMLFFLIQALAVVATMRLRPRGWRAVPMVLLTFAFNLATVRIFLAGLNAIGPFYVERAFH
ncbi:MAG TPA: MBOAT family O-acyltransferase [Tepidisphaeraceae bacterium]